jgi:hypothetical protein
MNPDDRIVDLVKRTLANLKTMDDLAANGIALELFEVTQMVNSLLSLLVVPRELGTIEFVGQSKGAHSTPNGIASWHRGPVQFELTELDRKPPQSLKKLLGGLRNSVAHATFEFKEDAEKAICALKFTSCGRTGTPFWAVTFHVGELRNFLFNLGDELLAARTRQTSRSSVSKLHKIQMTDLEISLPTSTLEQIERLVANMEVASRGQFIQKAVEAALRDDEDIAAA